MIYINQIREKIKLTFNPDQSSVEISPINTDPTGVKATFEAIDYKIEKALEADGQVEVGDSTFKVEQKNGELLVNGKSRRDAAVYISNEAGFEEAKKIRDSLL